VQSLGGYGYQQARRYLKDAESYDCVSTRRDGKTKLWYIADEDLYKLTDRRR